MSVHKFTVPDSDQIVEKWIANQSNYGVSIRMLINMFVTEHGYQDVSCMAIGLAAKKRGRPSKQLMQKMEQMTAGIQPQYDTEYDDVYDPDETEDFDESASYEDQVPASVPAKRPAMRPAKQTSMPVTEEKAESSIQSPVRQKQVPQTVSASAQAADQGDDILNMFNKPLSAGGNADTDDDADDAMASLLN